MKTLRILFAALFVCAMVFGLAGPLTVHAETIPQYDWQTFKTWFINSGITDPYELIDQLDSNTFVQYKHDNSYAGWTASADSVVWTTIEKEQTGLSPFLVDGRTGVFIASKGTKVLSPGASIELVNYDGKIPAVGVKFTKTAFELSPAKECIETKDAQAAFDLYFGKNNERLISVLDELANNNRKASLRASGPAFLTNVEKNKALFWTSGMVTGATMIVKSETDKNVWTANGGRVDINFAFSGIALCSPFNVNGETAAPANVEQPVAPANVEPSAEPTKEPAKAPVVKQNTASGNIPWWWLLILAVIFFVIWLLTRKPKTDEEKVEDEKAKKVDDTKKAADTKKSADDKKAADLKAADLKAAADKAAVPTTAEELKSIKAAKLSDEQATILANAFPTHGSLKLLSIKEIRDAGHMAYIKAKPLYDFIAANW
jgi:hypothetical protein